MKMRQFFIVAALGLAFVSCENQNAAPATSAQENNSGMKTAYVDTARLMTEMQWAQQREAELTRRQQTLMQKEQNYMKKFQEEGSVERDSLVTKVKDFIKTYAAENSYDYIYGTGDAATILFAKDEYDITDEIIKLMNEAYGKKDETTEEEPTAEETE